MFQNQLNQQLSQQQSYLKANGNDSGGNMSQQSFASYYLHSQMVANAHVKATTSHSQMVLVNNFPIWNQHRPPPFIQHHNSNFNNQLNQPFLKCLINKYQVMQQHSSVNNVVHNTSMNEHQSPENSRFPSLIKPVYVFEGRKFDDINRYAEFVTSFEHTKNDLRGTPNSENLSYLDWPHGSSMDQFELFHGFNFAFPQSIQHFKIPHGMSGEEYDEMKKDFKLNGADTNWTTQEKTYYEETFNLIDSFDFPMLELPSDSNWKLGVEVNPMQLANFSPISTSSPKTRQGSAKKQKPNKKSLEDHCAFCKNNGVEETVYMSHLLKDSEGKTICPRLRNYKCPTCGAHGDNAHTLNYCPEKKVVTMEDVEKVNPRKQPLAKFR